MRHVALILLSFTLGACEVDDDFSYDNVPDEPALTSDELVTLPDGLEHEHHEALEAALATETPEDDAANFDTDEVTGIVDEAVEDGAGGTASFQPLLRSGLHSRASDALRAAGVSAWRITQTIGNAPASAGVHARDGYVNGKPYTAAVDLSVSGLSTTQIHNLLERLAKLGFAVWYRKGGSDGWSGANHMHAVYANSAMKSALRSQVRSWLVGRNGLVSNSIYQFHKFSASAKANVKGKYAMSAQGTSNGGAGVSGRVNTRGVALTIRASASRSAAAVGSVGDGAYVTITCQKTGQSVTGTYGTT
ncbi:MAG: hypothetical protein H0T79_09530, partial [Deltaproteobacteria bacterium]|nr:hypothetical protein [Deltaproteobacteria bacterium]